LAIHAAKGLTEEDMYICGDSPFKEVLSAAGIKGVADLPRGRVLAIASLTDCIPSEHIASWPNVFSLSPYEQDFGNYGPGRWGFLLREIEVLRQPIPATGHLGLWEWVDPRTGR